MPTSNQKNGALRKAFILGGTTVLTLAIHYGWVIEPLFGHSHLAHAIHSRLCYIPIVMGSSWFGLRGGLTVAFVISFLVQPYIFLLDKPYVDVTSELIEIIFYFALATLTGALIDRESSVRRRHEETQLQLERSQKFSLLGQMAAGVAHEIKNPLASIKGAVEILGSEGTSPDEKKEFQDIALKEIKRLDSTVHEFLDFARSREMHFERLDLAEVVTSSLRQLQPQIENAGVKLSSQLSNNIVIVADPEKIHQIIINLALNAVDASSPGGEIQVALRADGKSAVLTIKDYGSGIEPSTLQRIFDPFYTTKSKGTGLGLAVVKSIVERHAGTIAVESKPGEGSRFTVKFPLEGKNR